LDDANIPPFTAPKVEQATKTGIIQAMTPKRQLPKVKSGKVTSNLLNDSYEGSTLTTATAYAAMISSGVRTAKYAALAKR